jgi:prolipoprotein diacylglyceryltransferase
MVLLWPSNYANFQHEILIEFVKINQVAFEEACEAIREILSIPFILIGLYFTIRNGIRK